MSSHQWYSSKHQKTDLGLFARLLRSDGFKITQNYQSTTRLSFELLAKKQERVAIRIIGPSTDLGNGFWNNISGMAERPCLAFNSRLSNQITSSLIGRCQKHGVLLCSITPSKYKFIEPSLSGSKIFREVRHIEAGKLASMLQVCQPGRRDWRIYEDICEEVFRVLFVPPLNEPRVQATSLFEISRRDFIFPNRATTGFWRNTVFRRYKGEYILLESKNLRDPMSKTEFDQGLGYLGPGGLGMFGIMLSRKPISPRVELIQSIAWSREGKMLIVLLDRDLKDMLREYETGGQPSKIVERAIDSVRIKAV